VTLTCRRVSLDDGAERPIINLLQLNELVERQHLLFFSEVRTNDHIYYVRHVKNEDQTRDVSLGLLHCFVGTYREGVQGSLGKGREVTSGILQAGLGASHLRNLRVIAAEAIIQLHD
jgi:hypothetical protein